MGYASANRHLEPSASNRLSQAFELADAGRRLVRLERHAPALARSRLDAVWERNAAAVANAVEQARERLPFGERKDGVDTAGRERGCRRGKVLSPPLGAA